MITFKNKGGDQVKVAQKQAKRRQEIAQAVAEILRTAHVESLTVDDICSAAGIAKGTFYHYFTSKEQLWNVISYPIDDFFHSLREELLSYDDFEEAIAQYAKNYAIYVTTSGINTCRTVIQSIISSNNSSFVDSARTVNHILVEIIQKAFREGQIDQRYSVEEIAEMLLLTCRGYILDCCGANRLTDLEERMAAHLRLLAHAFRAKPGKD